MELTMPKPLPTPEELMRLIAERLLAWRTKNGKLQRDAAEFFGVSRATFIHWENARRLPRGQKLSKVLRELNK